ncbi:uncharacterized protein BYT42DRAFT_616450 [Radiomyces spectabilis]|uniref:uncharacterized protein n=1 Tax=Radiomyces spectabilis TaxID=64574 RepID=UPI002220B08F|nr:uncharacterized protein BYT42DRAFT_616450 [Radiomyces spectabilis]KAI8371349.1 hypothetical protein BYT42DRAFT_616450 [Radiomyces spectabilis]
MHTSCSTVLLIALCYAVGSSSSQPLPLSLTKKALSSASEYYSSATDRLPFYAGRVERWASTAPKREYRQWNMDPVLPLLGPIAPSVKTASWTVDVAPRRSTNPIYQTEQLDPILVAPLPPVMNELPLRTPASDSTAPKKKVPTVMIDRIVADHSVSVSGTVAKHRAHHFRQFVGMDDQGHIFTIDLPSPKTGPSY